MLDFKFWPILKVQDLFGTPVNHYDQSTNIYLDQWRLICSCIDLTLFLQNGHDPDSVAGSNLNMFQTCRMVDSYWVKFFTRNQFAASVANATNLSRTPWSLRSTSFTSRIPLSSAASKVLHFATVWKLVEISSPEVSPCNFGNSFCEEIATRLRLYESRSLPVEANCSSKIESTPLTFIKWGLPEQEDIKDVTVLGTASSTVFNHLTTASLRGGYYATYRSGPPQVSTVIATGSFPFVAWHCLLEGSSGPILTDVAKAVASKFVSAIGSAVPWVGLWNIFLNSVQHLGQPDELMILAEPERWK